MPLYNKFYLSLGPVIISDGGSVENQSIVNDFSNNNSLTITCTSDDTCMSDVLWVIINQTGTVEKHFTNISNVSSSVTFINPSNNFTSYLRCGFSHHSYLHKDVFITKGKIAILVLQ